MYIKIFSIYEDHTDIIITDYIFDETLTTILNRGGKQLAIEVARKIFSSPTISIATINPEIFSSIEYPIPISDTIYDTLPFRCSKLT